MTRCERPGIELPGEVGREQLDHVPDLGPDDWEAAQPQPTLAKRYLDEKLAVALHLRLRTGRGGAHAQNLCVVFQGTVVGLGFDPELRVQRLPCERERGIGTGRDSRKCRVDRSVTVECREGIDGLDGASGRIVQSVVRLQPLDDWRAQDGPP